MHGRRSCSGFDVRYSVGQERWVGTGPKFDPEHGTVPMPAGSFVTHYGKQVHWDGAKDEDAVLLIMGEGPATSTEVTEEK